MAITVDIHMIFANQSDHVGCHVGVVENRGTLRKTAYGDVVGGAGSHGSDVWLGIPYARPPVGDLRWKAPRPPERWVGVRKALAQMAPCIQPDAMANVGTHNQYSADTFIGSEDCLYLNIWSPPAGSPHFENAGLQGLPVMFWLHGGGNVFHDCSIYDGGLLTTHGVVVVTLNFRLGAMGWFSHAALRAHAENEADCSANFGLLDIIQALRWVGENIRVFGGDPDNITLFGESAGGTDVLALIASPVATGLFHKAIAQSGTISAVPQARAEQYFDSDARGILRSSGETLLQLLIDDGRAACRQDAKVVLQHMTQEEVFHYLHGKSLPEIHRTLAKLIKHHSGSPSIMAEMTAVTHQVLILDDIVLPREGLLERYANSAGHRIPVMLGSTRDEDRTLLLEHRDFAHPGPGGIVLCDIEGFRTAGRLMSDLWKANAVDEPASALAKSRSGVYVYRFDWDEDPVIPGPDKEPIGAAHGADLKFLFGPHQYDQSDYQDHPTFEAFGQAMRSYWVQFARTGDPGTGAEESLPRWMPWKVGGTEGWFMQLDSDQDGGFRMGLGKTTRSSLLWNFRQDEGVAPLEARMSLFRKLLRYPYHWGRVTVEDFQELFGEQP